MVWEEEMILERDQSNPFQVRCILNKKSIMSLFESTLIMRKKSLDFNENGSM